MSSMENPEFDLNDFTLTNSGQKHKVNELSRCYCCNRRSQTPRTVTTHYIQIVGIVATDTINVCSQTCRTLITQLHTNAQQTWTIEHTLLICDYY